jgi:raffinose/stachyose/melibiose transport system substrate-binding protein
MRKVLLVIVVLLAAAGMSFAGGQKEKQAIKLDMWILSFVGSGEQQLPQDDWYLSKALGRFEEANPGVKVTFSLPADAMASHQEFKAAAMAQSGPDVANLWNGQYSLVLKDIVLPLNKMIPKEDRENIIGWDTVSVDFDPSNTIIGYPCSGMEGNFFLYNKKLVGAAGLNFETSPPPTTLDFLGALEKIKATGVTPMVADESYPFLWINISHYWWVQVSGLDKVLSSNRGDTKFSDDKGLLDALRLYRSFYSRGYLNEDAATSSDAMNRFYQGKAAIWPNGSFGVIDAQNALGVDTLGILKPPEMSLQAKITGSLIGGPGNCLVIAKHTKYPELCLKLISFLCSKDEQIAFTKVRATFPLRKDVTLEELGWANDPVKKKSYEWLQHYIYYIDGVLHPDLMDEISKTGTLVLMGKMTPEQYTADLDRIVQSISR